MSRRDGKTAPAPQAGNIADALPAKDLAEELVDLPAERPGIRVERIVSAGQTTPDGEWYDQDQDEWVMVASGAARVERDQEKWIPVF